MKFGIWDYFRTQKRAEVFLDHMDEEAREFLEEYRFSILEVKPSGLFDFPAWIEPFHWSQYFIQPGFYQLYQAPAPIPTFHDFQDPLNIRRNEKIMEWKAEYCEGYYEPLTLGEWKNIDGATWEYLDSIHLSEEEEIQCDNGQYVYYHVGPTHLRIWGLVPERSSEVI